MWLEWYGARTGFLDSKIVEKLHSSQLVVYLSENQILGISGGFWLIFQGFSPNLFKIQLGRFKKMILENTEFFSSRKVFDVFGKTKVCWKQQKQNKQTLNLILQQKISKSNC